MIEKAPSIEIREISAAETLELRQRVLRPHLSRDENRLKEDTMQDCLHLGGFVNSNLVSIASFYPVRHQHFSDKIQYRLRQMGADAEFRNMGLGCKLVVEAVRRLRGKNCRLIWCHARKAAYPFYEKLGFQSVGEEFDIPIIGRHKLMFVQI